MNLLDKSKYNNKTITQNKIHFLEVYLPSFDLESHKLTKTKELRLRDFVT